MPIKLCLEPRCPERATYRGRCKGHARARERQTHGNKAFYNSGKWIRTRNRVLFEEPICRACDDSLSVEVDHIVPIEDGGPKFERSNLQALCKPCHGAKTNREQRAR